MRILKMIPSVAWTLITFQMSSCRSAAPSQPDSNLADVSGTSGSSIVLDNINCGSLPYPVSVAFFDADSTLRISRLGKVSANGPTDVYVLPFTADKIAELNAQKTLVAVVSNQEGVSKGYVKRDDASAALKFLASQMTKLGARIDYIAMAVSNNEFRKPKIGMATELFGLIKTKCGKSVSMHESIMVGDSAYKKGVDGSSPDGRAADDFSNSDRLFAENLRIKFYEPTDYFNWRRYGVYNLALPEELKSFINVLKSRNPAEAAKMNKVNGL